jgi:nicotinate-nucleotide adenylyltransferase
MKTGLFFGSFNPIHIGHLAIATYIVKNGYVDKLWFVVTPQNPLKEKNDLLDDHLRLEMVKLAIEGKPYFEACDVEFRLSKPSFTINTLNHLKSQFPDHEFFIIMGSDNFVNFKKWKDYRKILSEYHFLIYPRPGFAKSMDDLQGNFTVVDAPMMEISSTAIRKAISCQQEVTHLLPSPVFDFILRNELYL